MPILVAMRALVLVGLCVLACGPDEGVGPVPQSSGGAGSAGAAGQAATSGAAGAPVAEAGSAGDPSDGGAAGEPSGGAAGKCSANWCQPAGGAHSGGSSGSAGTAGAGHPSSLWADCSFDAPASVTCADLWEQAPICAPVYDPPKTDKLGRTVTQCTFACGPVTASKCAAFGGKCVPYGLEQICEP